ncbi:MAG: MATE family efflux transporter, partial [Planctomycetota bacterium]
PSVFRFAGHNEGLASLEIEYFQILCIGAPAMLISQSLAAFFSGRGRTRVVMVVDALFAILNLGLDYVMIFGHAGFPAMGIGGAGWATVISMWLKVGAYLWLMLRQNNREQFATGQFALERGLFGRVLYFGGPSGLQIMLDVLGFSVFIMLLGRLGPLEAEATSMAFSISTLAFMPVHGLGMAASILVGQRLGEDRDDLAARATWTTLWVALAYMAFVSICYLLFPQVFLYAFFAGGTEGAVSNQEVWSLALTLLRFVAAYNLFDAAMMVFANAIKGAGDTRFVLKVSLAMATVLAVLSWLCVEVFALGIYGCWTIITGWIWGLGTIFCLRFLGGKWREMRVIDQTNEEPVELSAAAEVPV